MHGEYRRRYILCSSIVYRLRRTPSEMSAPAAVHTCNWLPRLWLLVHVHRAAVFARRLRALLGSAFKLQRKGFVGGGTTVPRRGIVGDDCAVHLAFRSFLRMTFA